MAQSTRIRFRCAVGFLHRRAPLPFALSWMALILALFASPPAWAINCARAANPVEKRICSSASLRAADAAMGRAYTALLAAAPDREIRAMLVRSQRRWVAARNDGLASDFDDAPLPIETLRDAILDRTQQLEDRSGKGLIAEAEAQRRFLAKYTGGPFTGTDTNCFFAPNAPESKTYSYVCTGALHVQNGSRVCSIGQDWATWRLYTHYGVSKVADGEAAPVAFCDDHKGDCSGSGFGKSGWGSAAAAGDNFPSPATGLPKLDAEGVWPLFDSDITWFNTCLTSPTTKSAG